MAINFDINVYSLVSQHPSSHTFSVLRVHQAHIRFYTLYTPATLTKCIVQLIVYTDFYGSTVCCLAPCFIFRRREDVVILHPRGSHLTQELHHQAIGSTLHFGSYLKKVKCNIDYQHLSDVKSFQLCSQMFQFSSI